MSTTDRRTTRSPAVSVVVPCYNLGRYLDEAIESVLAQSCQDFEILVVDDGSTEPETQRLLQDYSRPKTRVVRTENRGLPAAKNLGLAETSGDYVCMFDADDRLAPSFLEASRRVLDEDPSIAFVSHWFQTFGDEVWDWTPTRCDLEALLDANTVNGAALVRRTALEAVGGFDETMRDGCEDWDIWITLVEQGYPGHILEQVLFYYRRRHDSMSRVMMEGDRHPKLFRRLIEKHVDSYRRHLPALLARRERDASHLAKHVHALELDYFRELHPELVSVRDDVDMLARRLHTPERAAPERATARALGLEAEIRRAREEVAALRSSWSWWLTTPLRALVDIVRPKRGAGQ